MLRGESPPPPLLYSLGFRHLRSVLLLLQKMILLKLFPLGDGPAITFTTAALVQPGPSHPDDDPAYAGPYRRQSRR